MQLCGGEAMSNARGEHLPFVKETEFSSFGKVSGNSEPRKQDGINTSNKNKPILLVEDDHLIRESIKEFLQIEGYSVITATDGLEALDALEAATAPFGLIIVDLMMPIMDGRTFLMHERRKKYPHVHAIIFSASVRSKEVIEGATVCVSKSADLNEFLEAIRAFYKG
jgi:CheY-like chemotaxis protein